MTYSCFDCHNHGYLLHLHKKSISWNMQHKWLILLEKFKMTYIFLCFFREINFTGRKLKKYLFIFSVKSISGIFAAEETVGEWIVEKVRLNIWRVETVCVFINRQRGLLLTYVCRYKSPYVCHYKSPEVCYEHLDAEIAFKNPQRGPFWTSGVELNGLLLISLYILKTWRIFNK